MRMTREQVREEHRTTQPGHEQFIDTIYGVICSSCHNYILIDHTNCLPSCREHDLCREAYAAS